MNQSKALKTAKQSPKKKIDNQAVVGRFGAPHGILGYIKVISFTKPIENICKYKPWYLKEKDQYVELDIVVIKCLINTIIVSVNKCKDRDLVKQYTNKEIYVNRELFAPPNEDEYYWSDLIGLDVVTENNDNLGTITSIIETGANDVLVATKEKNTALIPYTLGKAIIKIDLDQNLIIVNQEQIVFDKT